MVTVSLSKPSKRGWHLATFRYGPSSGYIYERLTDLDSDFQHETGTYISEKAMQITLPEINGTLEEKHAEVLLPVSNQFADRISDGRAHSRVRASILEVSDTDGARDVIHLYKGRVIRSHRNHQGKARVVMLEVASWKTYLSVLEGLPVDPSCVFPLFGPGCQLSIAGHEHTGVLTAIDGRTVTIGGLPGVPARHLHRGYVEYQGVRISIREWISGTLFLLVRDPPADWLNATVKVVTGCSKTLGRCRQLLNEEHFGGFGYGTPAYSPVMEVG